MSVAEQRAPYGRTARPDLGPSPLPTYYGLPALKRSHYRWLIATYFFLGGLAGAAQLIATLADLLGRAQHRDTVRGGRYLALLGALLGPLLLIADLHTPRRWYNMLRIFRPTSPMSLGSWTLAAFGGASGLVALGQALQDLTGSAAGSKLARVVQLPAALLGAVMAVYTGVLLSATSTPLWAVASRHLPPLFGASAMATASAALSLWLQRVGAPEPAGRRLELLALVASGAQLALALAAERRWRRTGVNGPLEQEPLASVHRFGVLGLGIAAPLLVHALHTIAGRRSRTLSVLAAVATLVGGYAERAVILVAGNASAERTEAYFGITQPGPTRGGAERPSGAPSASAASARP